MLPSPWAIDRDITSEEAQALTFYRQAYATSLLSCTPPSGWTPSSHTPIHAIAGLSREAIACLSQLHTAFDEDQDGKLNEAELKRLLQCFGPKDAEGAMNTTEYVKKVLLQEKEGVWQALQSGSESFVLTLAQLILPQCSNDSRDSAAVAEEVLAQAPLNSTYNEHAFEFHVHVTEYSDPVALHFVQGLVCTTGYDFFLNPHAALSASAAIDSMRPSAWTLGADAAVVDTLNRLGDDLLSTDSLCGFHLLPVEPPSPLARLSLPAIRLRAKLLLRLNRLLHSVLPLVDFSSSAATASSDGSDITVSPHVQSIADVLCAMRPCVMRDVKMKYLSPIMDATAGSSTVPTIRVNRLSAASIKEQARVLVEAGNPLEANAGEGDGSHASDSEAAQSWKAKQRELATGTIFGQAFEQLKSTPAWALRPIRPQGNAPFVGLNVEFLGENVEGTAGPWRQFLGDVVRELQAVDGSQVLRLFVPCPNAQQENGENRDKFVLAPSATSAAALAQLRILGRLIGLALRTSALVSVDWPSFIWKPLVGEPLTREDLRQIDSGAVNTMELLEALDATGFESMPDMQWDVVRSDRSIVELRKDGSKQVTRPPFAVFSMKCRHRLLLA